MASVRMTATSVRATINRADDTDPIVGQPTGQVNGAIISVSRRMYDLLSRTVSQGLQAFLPIAFALTWLRRTGDTSATAGLRWGLLAAVPATLAAMYGFQH